MSELSEYGIGANSEVHDRLCLCELWLARRRNRGRKWGRDAVRVVNVNYNIIERADYINASFRNSC